MKRNIEHFASPQGLIPKLVADPAPVDGDALGAAWLLICGGALLCAAHAPARGILPRGILPLAIRRKEQDP